MKKIGLTGGIASGKSTIASVLHELGAYVIDADKIAREVVLPGSPAWKEIVREFGQALLQPDKSLNRAKLADFVFQDKKARQRLNQITHPRIIEKIRSIMDSVQKENKYPLLVVDAALLIEAGMTPMFDEVWLASLPESIQITRLMERDGLTKEEGEKRISSQLPLEEKKKFAHQIIDTSGSLLDTINQVYLLWNQINGHEKNEKDVK